MKLTPKQKKLAAMYGNPKKITRGDIITAAVKNKTKKKTKKQPKKQGKMVVCCVNIAVEIAAVVEDNGSI